jgi:hypothetical protein
MPKKSLKLSSLKIQSFITNSDQFKAGAGDYDNTFTVSSTIDFHHACTLHTGCYCRTNPDICLEKF